MEIVKLDDTIFKKMTDYQMEQAKKTIAECVSKGVGMYEIKDNDNIFPSKQVMYERLKSCAYTHNHHNANKNNENLRAEVITKNKKQQIIVVVKE